MERYWDGVAWDGYLRPASDHSPVAHESPGREHGHRARMTVAIAAGAVGLALFLNNVVWAAM